MLDRVSSMRWDPTLEPTDPAWAGHAAFRGDGALGGPVTRQRALALAIALLVLGGVAVALAQTGRSASRPDRAIESAPAAPTAINPSVQAGFPKPGETSLPRRPAPIRAQGADPAGSLRGYVFPVLGRSTYTDTWGAARASTGVPHEGTDIFAPEGTPVVAPADGVIDRVGWNRVGGYRFWLNDEYGNSFYNAHLVAYSPLARDGAEVRAGDVIGFVGSTGDAEGTPDHLHFEVHPGGGAPINPVRFLRAWLRGVAVPAAGSDYTYAPSRVAPSRVTGQSDISGNSGLEGAVLDEVAPSGSVDPSAPAGSARQ